MPFGSISVDEITSSNNISVTGNVSFTGNVTVGAGTVSNAAISTTGDPNTGIFFPAADTIAFAEGGAEAMRITSDGQVGIGNTSPGVSLVVQASVGSQLKCIRTSGVTANFGSNSVEGFVLVEGANPLTFYTNGANERARITSGGEVLVGTTSQVQSGKFCVSAPLSSFNTITLQNTTTQGAGQKFMAFMNSSAAFAGSIDHTGTTTVAYTTSSDYRMKEDVKPMIGALQKVSLLKPCTYKWKKEFGGENGQGFIAHELQSVVPACVTGVKDEVDNKGNPVYQGLDTSFLVATLTAAIQELKAITDAQASRIETLEAKVAALEANDV